MIHSKIGYAGVVGALTFGGAFAGCIDNGNDVGFEDGAGGGIGVDNTGITTVSTTGPGPGVDSNTSYTVVGGVGGSGGDGDTSYTVVGSVGTEGFTSVTGTVGTTGEGYGGGSTGVSTTGEGYGGGSTSVSTTGQGFGGSTTEGSTSTTGVGGGAEASCGPEELHCEVGEICRVVDTFGPLQYSCVPNPCYEHKQANSCECAASVCGGEAPNCVMIEDDTVVACVCVAC